MGSGKSVIVKFSSISTKWWNFAILHRNEKQDVEFKKWDVGIHEWEVGSEKWEMRFGKLASHFPHGIWEVGSGTEMRILVFKISPSGLLCMWQSELEISCLQVTCKLKLRDDSYMKSTNKARGSGGQETIICRKSSIDFANRAERKGAVKKS